MYQANVDRYEQERHRLALDLHDSVLNEMAALLMILDPAAQTPGFQKAYDALSQRVREIVTELRPPMLNFGLKLGLEEFADNLMERNKDTVEINVTIQGDEDVRYSQSVEHHIYRMVQEACENAVRHGQARHIHLSGALAVNHLNLFIEDDGHGFDASSSLRLDHLLAHKHFGLAGIVERALLIEAEVKIDSASGKGTRITIFRKPSL
jgi:signal transduction histidine kinase